MTMTLQEKMLVLQLVLTAWNVGWMMGLWLP